MPTSLEALLIAVLLVVPGFLTARVARSSIPGPLLSDGQFFTLALITGILIHTLLAPVTLSFIGRAVEFWAKIRAAPSSGYPHTEWPLLLWFLAIVFLIPVVVGFALSRLFRWNRAQRVLSWLGISAIELTPQAWDWFFLTQRRGCWVVVETTDGKLLGGEYGEASFASLSPHKPDLYIERAYYIDEDHNFLDPIPDSVGVWLSGEKVKALHFYRADVEA